MIKVGTHTLDTFTMAYLETALWASNVDDVADLCDIPDELILEAIAECADFQVCHADLLVDLDREQTGHDFYLTRERHGAGYWDGDYPDDIGRKLTDAAHVYGSWDEFTVWAMDLRDEMDRLSKVD